MERLKRKRKEVCLRGPKAIVLAGNLERSSIGAGSDSLTVDVTQVPASGESSKAQALKVELAEKQESRDSTSGSREQTRSSRAKQRRKEVSPFILSDPIYTLGHRLTKYSYPAGRPNATDADRQAWEAIQTKEAAERARHNLKSSQSAAKKKAQGKLRAGSPGWQSKEAVKKAKRALSSRVSYHKQADREKLQKKLEAPGLLDEDAEGDSDYDVEPQVVIHPRQPRWSLFPSTDPVRVDLQVSSSLGRAPLNRRQALLYSQTHTRPRSLF